MRRIALVVLLLVPAAMVAAGAPMASAGGCGGGERRPMSAGGSPFSAPGPPQNLSAFPGNQKVVLFWNAPAFDGGGVDFYRVYLNGVRKLRTTQTQAQVNGLTNGQLYTFTVTATNVCGESSHSDPDTATPSTGQDAELIGGRNLTMRTGGSSATAADPFIGVQKFPEGTTGFGTLNEESDNGFCAGPCLAGSVLVNALDGTLGGAFYTVKLLYDKTAVQAVSPPDGATRTGTGFTVFYDADKGAEPTQLSKCSSTFSGACVAKMVRDDGDLIVHVRTSDIDPRMGTR